MVGRTKRYVQWFIVWGLVNLCALLDHIPVYRRGEKGWHWTTAQWGCWPLGLAMKSDRLDQRWNTGVWTDIPPGEG
jgi:hypothetical protein